MHKMLNFSGFFQENERFLSTLHLQKIIRPTFGIDRKIINLIFI